jgi:hypothetical protein
VSQPVADPVAPRADPDPRSPSRRWSALAAAAIAVAVGVPLVVTGIAGAARDWYPGGDWAVLELRTHDVGSSLTPLLGPYSRFGWNHPGPLLFWVLAAPYRLLGARSSGMLLGAALVNLAAVGGALALAWRRGRLVLVELTAALVGVAMVSLGPSFLRDPWNPSVTVLPFLCFVLLVWSATDGDTVALPFGALVGSFLVQAHVGFALLVAALSVVAVVGYVRATGSPRRPGWWRDRRGALISTAAILAVAWLPVLVDQVAGDGNLGLLLSYFTGGGDEPAGVGTAAGVVARELGGVAPWMGGLEPGDDSGALLTSPLSGLRVPVAAFVAAAVLAVVAGARSAFRFQVVVGVTALVGLVSTSRVTGEVYAYLVRWWWVIAVCWWLAVLWSAWSSVPAVPRRALEPVVAVLAAATVVWSASTLVRAVDEVGTPDGEWWVTLEEVVPDTVAGVPRDGPVLVRAVGSKWGSIGDGVRLALEKDGVDVVVDEAELVKFGSGRSAADEPPASVVWVVTGIDAIERAEVTAGLTEIARWDPLPPDERVEYTLLATALRDQFARLGRIDLITALQGGGTTDPAVGLAGVDQDLLREVERYRRQGDPVAVFVGPPDGVA